MNEEMSILEKMQGLFGFAVAGGSFIFSTTAPLSNISDFNSEGRAQFPTLYFIVTSSMGGGVIQYIGLLAEALLIMR